MDMETVAPDRQMVNDVQLVVGGNFTPDALGPRHREVHDRIRARPADYLRVFESMFLGAQADVRAQSQLHATAFLRLVADLAPDRVRTLASRLVAQYNTAMAITDAATAEGGVTEALPEETARMARRLDARRRALNELIR